MNNLYIGYNQLFPNSYMFVLGFKILLNYLLYMQVDMFELYLRKPVLEHMRIENVSCGHYLGSYLAMYGYNYSN